MANIFQNIKHTYQVIFKFLTYDVWHNDFSELSKIKNKFINYLRVILVTCNSFFSQRIGREAVCLSFFGMMSMVPLVAIILFVSNGFGLDKLLSEMLFQSFPESTKLINVILRFANNIIVSTDKGAFGWISFLAFVWTVIWLMLNIEMSFNRIWKVRKSRTIWKRVLVYFTILILAPFIMLLFLYGWAYYMQFIHAVESYLKVFKFITSELFWVGFYGVSILVLSLIYKFIPNAKVRYGCAFNASMVSGLAFVAIQYLYMETQLMVTRLNGVYGAFAAVPLFMIWMNTCWFIILFGAELSYGFQNVNLYIDTKREEKRLEAGRANNN